MTRYISYKRFEKKLSMLEIQEFFDSLIKDGYEIITYTENNFGHISDMIYIVVVIAGKVRNIL